MRPEWDLGALIYIGTNRRFTVLRRDVFSTSPNGAFKPAPKPIRPSIRISTLRHEWMEAEAEITNRFIKSRVFLIVTGFAIWAKRISTRAKFSSHPSHLCTQYYKMLCVRLQQRVASAAATNCIILIIIRRILAASVISTPHRLRVVLEPGAL